MHRKVSEVVNDAIVHYRDDLDLQNLIDFGQKEVSLGLPWSNERLLGHKASLEGLSLIRAL